MRVGDRTTYYHGLLDATFKVRVTKITRTHVIVEILNPLEGMKRIRAFTHRQAEELGS